MTEQAYDPAPAARTMRASASLGLGGLALSVSHERLVPASPAPRYEIHHANHKFYQLYTFQRGIAV